MADKSPVPKRLKEARLAAGLSQKQLGIKAGMDPFSASARVNQYERGKHMPDFGTAARLAKVLRIPTAYLFTENNELAEILRIYPSLSVSARKKLLADICKY
jgi:transcriptional regulator with XRE-family HTH domain